MPALQCGSGQFEPATSYSVSWLKLKPNDSSTGSTLRRCLQICAALGRLLRALDRDDAGRESGQTATTHAVTRGSL